MTQIVQIEGGGDYPQIALPYLPVEERTAHPTDAERGGRALLYILNDALYYVEEAGTRHEVATLQSPGTGILDIIKILVADDVLIGDATTTNSWLVMDGVGTNQRRIYLARDGVNCWQIQTGSNGDLNIIRHDPATGGYVEVVATFSLADGAVKFPSSKHGFFDQTPVSRPVVSGWWQDEALLALYSALDQLGLIDNQVDTV